MLDADTNNEIEQMSMPLSLRASTSAARRRCGALWRPRHGEGAVRGCGGRAPTQWLGQTSARVTRHSPLRCTRRSPQLLSSSSCLCRWPACAAPPVRKQRASPRNRKTANERPKREAWGFKAVAKRGGGVSGWQRPRLSLPLRRRSAVSLRSLPPSLPRLCKGNSNDSPEVGKHGGPGGAKRTNRKGDGAMRTTQRR
jgi:hypothetical protein